MRGIIVVLPFLLNSCFQTPSPLAQEPTESICELPSARFPVQSVVLNNESNEYNMLLLGAPSCLKQPHNIANVQMARLDSAENGSHAVLSTTGAEPVLYLSSDFKINVVQPKIDESGMVTGQSESSWLPFLASAAGGMAVGAIASKMFSQPRQYAPPKFTPGQKEIKGLAELGQMPLDKSAAKKKEIKSSAPKVSNSSKKIYRKKTFTQRLKTKSKLAKRKIRKRFGRKRR